MAIGGVGVGLALARNDAAKSERDLSAGVQQVLRLTSAYTDMETGERGFVIGGSEVFLEPYNRGLEAVDELQAALARGAARDDRITSVALSATVAAGNRWRERASEVIALRRTRGRPAAESAIASRIGKERFDTLRKTLVALTQRLGGRLQDATRHREHRAQQLTALLLAVPVAGLIFTALAAVALTRWVGRPLSRMLAAVRAISTGDLSANVEVGGAADVAEVGATIDAMRVTIAARLAEAERLRDISDRAREALEQNTTVTLQLRSELASELGTLPRGWTAAANLLPAEGWVAGDCYDVTLVSPHVLGIIVIDIAGHGALQAIVALRCKEILRAALRMHLEPGAALGLLAEQVGDLHPSFVTGFVALLDTTTGACRYANAGHPPALLAGHDNVVHELGPTGPLLGVFDASWSTASAHLSAGTKLAVYTDGLTEARNHAEEFYGMERLAALLVTLPCETADAVIKSCVDDLHVFRPSRMSDDVTTVLVCRECEAS